jgi:hypothetical protein
MSVQLLRNTRLWASTAATDADISTTNTWEVLIQDDFSFNQDGNSTDISLTEAGPVPTRGSRRFNDSLNPVDWNFSTYLRPYLDSGVSAILTPDYALWHSLASGSALNISDDKGVEANSTNMLVKFTDNQHHELNKISLYYLVDAQWYKVEEVQINQAEISIEIDGIGLTAWTGQGTNLIPLGITGPEVLGPAIAASKASGAASAYDFPDAVFNDSTTYVRNRLTEVLLRDNGDYAPYNVPVTGGTITISNNITYLTPSTLSRIDLPIGSFTGTFEVTGSIDAYLRTSQDITEDAAAELLNKLVRNRDITNSFQMGISLGGIYDTPSPAVVVVLPIAHLSIPSIRTDDVLGTTIEFKGIPTSLDGGDEVFLGMSPTYTRNQIRALIHGGDGAASIPALPSFTTQPTDQTAAVGAGVTLSSEATADSVRYQWFKGNTAISGETSQNYTISAAATEDAGTYWVGAFNSINERVASNTVTVTITE